MWGPIGICNRKPLQDSPDEVKCPLKLNFKDSIFQGKEWQRGDLFLGEGTVCTKALIVKKTMLLLKVGKLLSKLCGHYSRNLGETLLMLRVSGTAGLSFFNMVS